MGSKRYSRMMMSRLGLSSLPLRARLTLRIWFYVWAFLLVLNPASAFSVYAQDVNRSTNGSGLIFDLNLNQLASGIDQAELLPKLFIFFESLDSFSLPKKKMPNTAWAIQSRTINTAFSRGAHPVSECLIHSFSQCKYGNSFLKSKENDLDSYTAFKILFIDIRIKRLNTNYGQTDKEIRIPFKFVSLVKNTPGLFTGLSRDLRQIKQGRGVFTEASKGEKNIANLPDLTNRIRPIVFEVNFLTISSNNQFLWGSCYNNACSLRQNLASYIGLQGEEKQEEEESSPQWIRIRTVGPLYFYRDPKGSDSTVFSLKNFDIDVSNDNKQWFHLFGPHCLQKLPKYHFLKEKEQQINHFKTSDHSSKDQQRKQVYDFCSAGRR